MPPRTRGGRKGDRGFVQVFEAMTIALILSVAFFYILSFDGHSGADARSRVDLQRAAQDGVRTLSHTVSPDTRYGDAIISKAVSEALRGEPANLTGYLDRFFPAGTVYNVYLSNGFDRRDLQVVREPAGATAGAATTFEPGWSAVRSVPDLAVLPDTGIEPVVATLVPFERSAPPFPTDGLVEFIAKGTVGKPGGGTRPFTATAYAVSATAPAPDHTDHASVRLSFECVNADLTTEPCWTSDLVATPTRWPQDLTNGWWKPRVLVDNEGTHTIPVGATVRIDAPQGAKIGVDLMDPEWATDWDLDQLVNGETTTSWIQATTTVAIPAAGSLELPFYVDDPYADDRLAHEVWGLTFNAPKSDRDAIASTRAFVVSRFTGSPSVTDVPVVLYPSVPFPAAPVGGSSTWTLVLASPLGPDQLDTIDVRALGDGVRFDCAGLTASTGTIAPCSPTAFTWTGPVTGTGGVSEVRFTVVSADAPRRLGPDALGGVPSISFDGGTQRALAGPWVAPGASLVMDLPAATGPVRPGHGAVSGPAWINWTTDAAGRVAALSGPGTLTVHDDLETELTGFRHAIHAGRFTVDTPVVRLGETASFTVDVRELMALLVAEGDFDESTATLRVLAPWAVGTDTADTQVAVSTTALRDGVVTLDHDVAWDRDWGLHVVELAIQWEEDDAESAAVVPQTATLVTTFVVVGPDASIPLGRALSPSPAYGLEIIAWLEHWG